MVHALWFVASCFFGHPVDVGTQQFHDFFHCTLKVAILFHLSIPRYGSNAFAFPVRRQNPERFSETGRMLSYRATPHLAGQSVKLRRRKGTRQFINRQHELVSLLISDQLFVAFDYRTKPYPLTPVSILAALKLRRQNTIPPV